MSVFGTAFKSAIGLLLADIAAAVLAIAKDPPDYVLAALSLILGVGLPFGLGYLAKEPAENHHIPFVRVNTMSANHNRRRKSAIKCMLAGDCIETPAFAAKKKRKTKIRSEENKESRRRK